jgi:hypothetical protein
MDLLAELWPYIEAGHETPKIELKRLLDLDSNRGKAEFVKDVTALANTPGGDGYLIIGVHDSKERQPLMGESAFDFLCGVSPLAGDQAGGVERQMNQVLDTYCSPPPSVGYRQFLHEISGKWLGIVTVPKSSSRPHVITRGGEGIQAQDIWVRRGENEACCFKASRTELEEMFAQKGFAIASSIDPSTNVTAKPIAIAIGLGGSIQGAVMKWLYDFQRPMPVRDYSIEGFVPEQRFGEVIREFNAIKAELTDGGVTEVHLFYKGPVTLAMALGAILSNWVPLHVYAFAEGSYRREITFDKKTVRGG